MKNIFLLQHLTITLLNNIILEQVKKIPSQINKKRKKGILYSVNSWNRKFYNHTNENAEDLKIDITEI